jgi:hypothetical protein
MNHRAQPQPNGGQERSPEPSLKGAFVSVMLMGSFFILAWFGVFALYLARN